MMATTAIPGVGLADMVRLTWVQDLLVHVLDHWRHP